MKALTTVWVVGIFATIVAMADDAGDVKAAFLAMFAAINAGDAGTMTRHHTAAHSGLNRGRCVTCRRDESRRTQEIQTSGFRCF